MTDPRLVQLLGGEPPDAIRALTADDQARLMETHRRRAQEADTRSGRFLRGRPQARAVPGSRARQEDVAGLSVR